jgi:transcriptional regulator of arginine metabolism
MGKGVRRRELIAAALQQGTVASQAEVCALLEEHGVGATQATVSRDLRELGAIKSADGYRLMGYESNGASQSNGATQKSMRQALETFLVSADVAGNLVVLRTGPGQAQVVAVEFDRHPQPEVVGVIAGDDTIFLAMTSVSASHALCDQVLSMAGLGVTGGAK